MQGDKTAMSTVMEAAANVAASAKSGLDKTKAVVEEKLEKMSTTDEVEKDMAKLRKEERIDLAELRKVKAYAQNAAAAVSRGSSKSPKFTDGGHFTTIGSFDQPAAIISTNTADQIQASTVAGAAADSVVGSGNGPEKKAESRVDMGRTEGVDSNPTQTGVSMPSVQPGTGGTGFGSTIPSDTNTSGVDTHVGPK